MPPFAMEKNSETDSHPMLRAPNGNLFADDQTIGPAEIT
jgi:hypothetical protein